MHKKHTRLKVNLTIISFYLGIILLNITNWITSHFAFSSFDQILYTLKYGEGTSKGLINDFISSNLLLQIIFLIITLYLANIVLTINKHYDFTITIAIKKLKINLTRNKLIKRITAFIIWAFMLTSLIILTNKLYIPKYIINIIRQSYLIEENYIDPKNVEIKFNENKKNLIYIFIESMESTFASVEDGGRYKINYIPELTKLANENVNFSNNDKKVGGAYQAYLTTWTIGGMFAQTSGLPLRVAKGKDNAEDNFTGVFMSGVYTLGEILESAGYNNYLMMGSDADFGSRKDYFTKHGNYRIYDYYQAIEDGIIEENYYYGWGMEDKKLIEYAKQELTKISLENEPFNFTLLTVDTHGPEGGYLECEGIDDKEYLNSVYCSDRLLKSFVDWIQRQPFYKNTVLIMVGDHTTMNVDVYEELGEKDRYIYNVIINSEIEPLKENNRKFSSFDMFPTTLASLGAEIEGNKLGLGVNLFSDEKTLLEKHGYKYVNKELLKNSIFYNKCLALNNCKN